MIETVFFMELKGKKIAFLGDSITEGAGVNDQEQLFWKVIGRETGAQCYGYGIGGTRIAPQRVVSEENNIWDRYFASRVDEMIPDADVVVIFGGTNDFGHGDAAMGKLGDCTNDTFYGAYHLLIAKLIERYPAAQLVIMTPLHRESEDNSLYNEWGVRRVGVLSDYVCAIREVAESYGVPVVDLFKNCGIQPKNPVHKQKYAPDGLHPNDEGHKLVAKCVLSVLNGL